MQIDESSILEGKLLVLEDFVEIRTQLGPLELGKAIGLLGLFVSRIIAEGAG